MFQFSYIHLVLCIVYLPCGLLADEDFYKLLGTEKDADLREIRRAFKKLAVIHHPDKNPDDLNAHDYFVKLAEAYEILKDPTKRRDYDLYGKKKFQNQSPPQYHSYSYYRDQFGIYDDDPLIATLGNDDFESSVEDTVWFINFYSPFCSHCHHLAPDWRKLSEVLEGVVKIGAVNCEDDRNLCWRLQIQQYPTLLFYNEKASMNDGTEYEGNTNAVAMEKFIMHHLSKLFVIPTIDGNIDAGKSPWLLFLCDLDEPCIDKNTRIKVAAVLRGLVTVGFTDDKKVIAELSGDESSKILFWQQKENESPMMQPIRGDEYTELADQVLNLLPEAQKLDQQGFQDARTQLRIGADTPWLLCFTLGMDTQKTVTLKKLNGLLDGFHIGEVNCAKSSDLCASLHIARYPTWAILKKGGAFEVLNGRASLHTIEKFARETHAATNLHALSPQDLNRIMAEGTPWIVGWLLTGCPPCKKILPALRKASNYFTPDVIQFGTVDCALHSHVCSRFNVHSYPTTVIYNASTVNTFQGESNEQAIVEFIRMMKSNYVKTLNADNFQNELGNKPESHLYVVEFYAPWCGPCQKLQPEWRKMAEKLSHLKKVFVGAVNCELQVELCSQQGIRSYPTIRLYPTGSRGLNTMAIYSSHNRDSSSMQKWVLSFIPSSVVNLNTDNFKSNLLSNREDRTWVIMYFAPWCGFCHQFEPEFITVIQRLESIVVGGKVDCQRDGALCQDEDIGSYPTVKLFQRVDGVTKITGGITIDGFTQEALYSEIKALAANAYITPIDHDEL